MKSVKTYLEAMCFFFLLLIANSIYAGPCGAGFGITPTYNSNCNYTFTPRIPNGTSIDHYHWDIGSDGTYGKRCDTFATSSGTPAQNYTFCFSGNHAIVLTFIQTNGTTCTVTIVQNVTCTGADVCDPNPARTDPITDPLVEITYVAPFICGTSSQQWHGCMFGTGCGVGTYCIACGWTWNVRIVPSTFNCDPFTYRIVYMSAGGPTGPPTCDSACVVINSLVPGQDYCIDAKLDQDIYVVATANNCCLPTGYEAYFLWHPTPSTTGISAPTPSYGICGNQRCPTTTTPSPCNENQQVMNSYGPVTTPCFWSGGGKKTSALTGSKTNLKYWQILEENSSKILSEFANIEQNVIVINVQGIEVFNGKWKFGDLKNLNLNWPSNIGTGLYFVRFPNSKANGLLLKLYKFN